MCRISLAILISLFCFGPTVNSAAGQSRKIDSEAVLKALLAMPAPTPRGGQSMVPAAPQEQRPSEFYDREKHPPDDAPIEDLIDYWQRWADGSSLGEPSKAVQKRLLEACVSNPQLFRPLVDFLPDDDSTPAKVKNAYDKALSDQQFDQEWRDKIRKWLVYNSTYFLDELIALAHKVKDNAKAGDVVREDALVALADVSWTNAVPLLRGLMASGQPRATALALSLFYEHAIDENDSGAAERYRRDLKAIAANRAQPGYARYTAIESLSITEWPDRDQWYTGLFMDETLIEAADDEYSTSPLITLFSRDPDKWIPIMVHMLESKNLNERTAAAVCLLSVDAKNEEKSRKALLALLPWLTNPTWANDPSSYRMRLIQLVGSVNLPEGLPALISLVEAEPAGEQEAYLRGFAAQALGKYQDPRVAPTLKKALAKERLEAQRFQIMQGLLKSNGLSEDEQIKALEEYASKITTPEGRAYVTQYRAPHEEPLPLMLTIGKYLGLNRESPAESLVQGLLARAEQLKSENSAVADALLEIAHQWQGQQVELDIIRRIANGFADAPTIAEALQRRDKMQQGLRTELEGLAAVAGAAQGVGAVLLNNSGLAQGVLNSEDVTAQIALLACARLTQTSLPIELLGPFLRHKDPLLTQAAETYLLAEDSAEARNLLWQRHPNKAFITGWRENIYYGGNPFQALAKNEEKLREELLKDNGPTEIVALISNVVDQGLILRVYPDKAVYFEQEDEARHRERTVSNAEVLAFKDYLTTSGIADRGPTFEFCHHGCPINEMLFLTREKGRRVLYHGGWQELQSIREHFTKLAAGDGAKVHYKLEQEIKGLEVVYAGELGVTDVAQQGGELRVLVERSETDEESKERLATYEYDEDEDEEISLQRIRRRLELEKSRFTWRVLANDKIGAVTSQPDFYSTFDESRFLTGDDGDSDWEDGSGSAQVLTPDSIIVARDYDGLWRQFAGTKPVRLGTESGSYSNAIVTRDGKWVVVAKSEEEEPAHLVRLNLQTGREFRINLPIADRLVPIAALPWSGKVVIQRAKSEYVAAGTMAKGPDRPEYYLLDPATGATRLVTGEFTPLEQFGYRFLQPAEKPDEYWAAIPDNDKNQTQIGRYSVKDFSFKPVMVVPQLIFESKAMWVDASRAKVYVVYKTQLLRLPLQATAK